MAERYTPEGFLGRVDTTLASGGSEAIAYCQYDSAGSISDVTRLQDRTVALLIEARARDPFGPNAGNFVKVELLGLDLATPFGGFEATLLGFFFGRDSGGNFQFGPFVGNIDQIGSLALDQRGGGSQHPRWTGRSRSDTEE